MNLQGIEDKECPICGSCTVGESRREKHSNGYWNEMRTFKCGARIDFSPDFMKAKMSKYNPCPYTSTELEKKEQLKIAQTKLVNYVNKYLKLNKNVKAKLRSEIDLFFRIRI